MRYGPTETGGIFEFGVKSRGVDQELLGHAATDDAGTTEPVFLGDHDARPMFGGDARGANAARSASDHEKIDVMFGHVKYRVRAFSFPPAFYWRPPRKAYRPSCWPLPCFRPRPSVLR